MRMSEQYPQSTMPYRFGVPSDRPELLDVMAEIIRKRGWIKRSEINELTDTDNPANLIYALRKRGMKLHAEINRGVDTTWRKK